MRYRIAMGPIAGRNTLRLQVPGGGATQGESAKLAHRDPRRFLTERGGGLQG